ncbi:hypothetical protein D3C72_1307040 [compost metagenome]
MPTLIPVWRKAFIVADAMPARSAGAVPMTTRPVAGTASPAPTPSKPNREPTIQYGVSALKTAMADMAIAVSP